MMKRFFQWAVIFQLLAASTLLAQNVADGWVIENIHGPSQVGIVDTIPVDINHDGLIDVVSASIEDGHLRAYINQGGAQDLVNLKFEQLYISKNLPGIYRVSATDLNHDGEIDFLLTSIETHEIIAMIAEPNGYRKKIIASGILLPTDALPGDFNKDGLMDVVSISFELNAVFLHLQNKDGDFLTEVINETVQRPRKLMVENFNNDFQMDFMVASAEDNSIRLFTNLGQAAFEEQLISNQMVGVRYIVKCDADGNDLIDFVVSATSINTVYLFTNLGNNNFSTQIIDPDLPGATALNCADIDNDQGNELVVISSQLGNIYTQELNGANKQLIANTRDGYVSVKMATFEHNEPPKILTQAFYQQRNLLYDPSQNNEELVVWEDFPDRARKLITGDLNADGIEEVVLIGLGEERLYVYDLNQTVQYVLAEGLGGVDDVKVVDLNQDNKLDILISTSFGGQVIWFRNMGDFNFDRIVVADVGHALGFEVVDLNDDLLKDVIVTSAQSDTVWWYEFNGNTFNEHQISQDSEGAVDVCAAHFNHDDLIDFAVLNYFGGTIDVYLNSNNAESFSRTTVASGMSYPFTFQCIDYDFDQDIDFISSVIGDGVVLFHENLGNLSFFENLITNELTNPRGFFIRNDNQSARSELYLAVNGENKVLQIISDQSTSYNLMDISLPLFGVNSIFSPQNGLSPEGFTMYLASVGDSAVRKLSFHPVIFRNGFD